MRRNGTRVSSPNVRSATHRCIAGLTEDEPPKSWHRTRCGATPTAATRRSRGRRERRTEASAPRARGATIWRTANGPKPDSSYLTPGDAADELPMILARAPHASATRRRRSPSFGAVAWDWLEHGERKRGLKPSTLRDYRYLLRNHLLPAFGERPVRAITRREIERWHAGYERTRTAAGESLPRDEPLRVGNGLDPLADLLR